MTNKKHLLIEVHKLLLAGSEVFQANLIEQALNGGEERLLDFLISNELWGGSGSIADQALVENTNLRKQLEELLVELGEIQIMDGHANERTKSWVRAFKNWAKINKRKTKE